MTNNHFELDESSRHENIMNSRSTATPNLMSFSTQCIAAHLIRMYMIIGTVTLSSINKFISHVQNLHNLGEEEIGIDRDGWWCIAPHLLKWEALLMKAVRQDDRENLLAETMPILFHPVAWFCHCESCSEQVNNECGQTFYMTAAKQEKSISGGESHNIVTLLTTIFWSFVIECLRE